MGTTETNQSETEEQNLPVRFLRFPEVQSRCGLSRPHIHKLAANGLFPKPVKINPNGRASGWIESEITAWINKRIADSRDQDAA